MVCCYSACSKGNFFLFQWVQKEKEKLIDKLSTKKSNFVTSKSSFFPSLTPSLIICQERDPIEGPVPRLDTRLCLLLSITTLAIADIIEEEEVAIIDEKEYNNTNNQWTEKQVVGKRRMDLISSLKNLGDYEALLTPPQSVISAANQAAAKAMMFVSGLSVGSGYFDCISKNDMPLNCCKKYFDHAFDLEKCFL